MSDISALGVHKEEWLNSWNVPQDERESTWRAKLDLDYKVANGCTDKSAQVMGDIQPYISQIDGSIINSRSQHRTHLRDNNCIEIGNEKVAPKPIEPPKGLRDTIGKAVYQHLG